MTITDRGPHTVRARLQFEGAVDADGHVLEPADLWEQYLEARYRDRAIRLKVDDEGLEYFDWGNGTESSHGSPGMLGTMGDPDAQRGPDRRYMEVMPFGACNPVERVQLLDAEGLERALLYPTLGLMWECQVTDPELTYAYLRVEGRLITQILWQVQLSG